MSENEDEEPESKPVILLVDDEPRNLQLLGNALFRDGYDVAFASSGQEALDFLQESLPDLILLDVMMPGMDGYEACRRIKSNPATAGLAVVFVTARTQKEDILEGFRAGAADYVTKPIQIAEVLARVKVQIALKQAQDKLEASNQQLADLIDTQRQFLSILTHDVRAPLAGLKNILSDLIGNRDDLEKEDMLELVATCEDSATRLTEFFEDLLSWANSTVSSEQKRTVFPLRQCLDGMIDLLKPLLDEKEQELEVRVESGIAARSDPKMVATVFRNLMTNAIKFTPVGGKVTVSTEERDGRVFVSVRDTGVGIPPERVPFVLDASKRRSTLGTSNEKGVGIGLSLCKSLVEALEGKLTFTTEVNRGTTFTFDVEAWDGETI